MNFYMCIYILKWPPPRLNYRTLSAPTPETVLWLFGVLSMIVVLCFPLICRSPLYAYTTLFLPCLLLMAIQVVSGLALLKIKLLCALVYRILCEHIFMSLAWILKSTIYESYGNFSFNCIRNFQTVSHIDCGTLHSQ